MKHLTDFLLIEPAELHLNLMQTSATLRPEYLATGPSHAISTSPAPVLRARHSAPAHFTPIRAVRFSECCVSFDLDTPAQQGVSNCLGKRDGGGVEVNV